MYKKKEIIGTQQNKVIFLLLPLLKYSNNFSQDIQPIHGSTLDNFDRLKR